MWRMQMFTPRYSFPVRIRPSKVYWGCQLAFTHYDCCSYSRKHVSNTSADTFLYPDTREMSVTSQQVSVSKKPKATVLLLLPIPSWPFSSPTHSSLVISSRHTLEASKPQRSFSPLPTSKWEKNQPNISCFLSSLWKAHFPATSLQQRQLWQRDVVKRWKEERRKMRIMIWGRRRSGGWVEVKHNGNRMGGTERAKKEKGWEVVIEDNKKWRHKLQRGIRLMSGTNSPSGKARDFWTTYVPLVCFSCLLLCLLF